MWRLYLDENMPVGIVRRLWDAGFDATCARDRGRLRHHDWDHLKVAATSDRVLVSNDWDFLQRHADWMQRQEPHCGIVIVPIQNEDRAFELLTSFLEATAPEDLFSECTVLS